MWFFPENSSYNFEAVWGQYGLKSSILCQSHSKLLYSCIFYLKNMDMVLSKNQEFLRNFCQSDFLKSDTKFYNKICLKYFWKFHAITQSQVFFCKITPWISNSGGMNIATYAYMHSSKSGEGNFFYYSTIGYLANGFLLG